MCGPRGRGALPAVSGVLCVLAPGCSYRVYPSEPPPVALSAGFSALVSREDPDVGVGALLAAKLSRPELELRPALDALDELAAVLRRRLHKGAEPRQFAGEITSLLFEERCFRCVDSDALEASDLALVLERKEGNCLGLSFLYLALARRLGAAFWGVACPEHYFVRFDDGTIRFNIELTMSGRELPDWYYKRWKRASKEAVARGTYLRNDGARRALAVLLASRAGTHLLRREPGKALRLLKLSLELRPGWPQGYVNRGLAREMGGELAVGGETREHLVEAEKDYSRALELDPWSASAMNNLAALLASQGRDLRRARELSLRAVKLRPDRKEFHRTAAEVLERLGGRAAAGGSGQ